MTIRQDLINLASREVYEKGFSRNDVSKVVDDTVRSCHCRVMEYYKTLTQDQLKRLDNAVWKRVEYLRSFDSAKFQKM